jgi:hypothetical protein
MTREENQELLDGFINSEVIFTKGRCNDSFVALALISEIIARSLPDARPHISGEYIIEPIDMDDSYEIASTIFNCVFERAKENMFKWEDKHNTTADNKIYACNNWAVKLPKIDIEDRWWE